jgi:sortase A
MRPQEDLPLGAECAWPIPPKSSVAERIGLALVAVLLALGTWQAGRGAWLQAKAGLAQILIARAWARTLAGQTAVKPWPWADTWPVAKLIVPRLGIERYVLTGAEGSAIAFGPGHAGSSARPGEHGNSVIGGHRDTHLAFLREVRPGDALIIERPDKMRVTYRVGRAEILDRRDFLERRDFWVIRQAGPTRLTLITHYPFDARHAGGPQRYVLLAFLS